MENVEKTITKKYGKKTASTLFTLHTACTDSKCGVEIEKWIQEQSGYPANKNLAQN